MSGNQVAERACVVWRGQLLVTSTDEPLPVEVEPGFTGSEALVPVSSNGGHIAAFLLDAPDLSSALAVVAEHAPGAVFADVMIELGRYNRALRGRVVRALAIERWSNRYRFCPACSYSLIWTSDAVAKICTSPARVHRHFPRLDPAIIVLVTHHDCVLLGRAARWPAGWYSTLAGFVEPGETVEAAIVREVFEEAGVSVATSRYFGSESWPFPRSLMLGFVAEAQTTEIALHDRELEEARWFTRPELRALQANMKHARPFFDTIARRMIDAWLAAPHLDPAAHAGHLTGSVTRDPAQSQSDRCRV